MEMKFARPRLFAVALVVAAAGLTACSLAGGAKPTVVIASPPSGSSYNEGDSVAVQSTSIDSTGVTRVEFDVDGAVVRNDTPPTSQTNYQLIQTWKATAGSHTLVVRAYNAAGVASDPAAISIQVNPSVAQNAPAATAVVTSTQAPAGGVTPTMPVPVAGNCTDNSAFVTDVTVPDGTAWAPGQSFNKIWRLSNDGTCAWGAGYQFVFVAGEAMTSNTVVSVPATNPGATADILVPMTAPGTSGNHSGTWRMRSPAGASFGQSLSVKIVVTGGAPPPSNPPANPPPSSSCTGTPVIASFTASPASIPAGGSSTLNWGAVTNADSAEIDNGIGGVTTPGSKSVSPSTTTTYTMTAHCGSNTASLQTTVTVNPALPPPVIFIYNYAGHWDINFGTMDVTQNGTSVAGNYFNGSCHGTVSGTVLVSTLNGAWSVCGASPFSLVGTDSNHFDGSGGGYKWCGARSGVAFAAGCGFAGHWNLNTNGASEQANLTQTGNSVQGTFGPGPSYNGKSVSGTVTGWTLNGTWQAGANHNSFKWVIDPADLSFHGHFTGIPSGDYNWCGWRNGQSAIPNGSCHD